MLESVHDAGIARVAEVLVVVVGRIHAAAGAYRNNSKGNREVPVVRVISITTKCVARVGTGVGDGVRDGGAARPSRDCGYVFPAMVGVLK